MKGEPGREGARKERGMPGREGAREESAVAASIEERELGSEPEIAQQMLQEFLEAASLMVMPRNSLDDPCYESLKAGQLPHLSQYSDDLNNLLSSMVRQDPDTRPRAEDVLTSLGQPPASVSRSELYRELEQTRQKLSFLENKLGMQNS